LRFLDFARNDNQQVVSGSNANSLLSVDQELLNLAVRRAVHGGSCECLSDLVFHDCHLHAATLDCLPNDDIGHLAVGRQRRAILRDVLVGQQRIEVVAERLPIDLALLD